MSSALSNPTASPAARTPADAEPRRPRCGGALWRPPPGQAAAATAGTGRPHPESAQRTHLDTGRCPHWEPKDSGSRGRAESEGPGTRRCRLSASRIPTSFPPPATLTAGFWGPGSGGSEAKEHPEVRRINGGGPRVKIPASGS